MTKKNTTTDPQDERRKNRRLKMEAFYSDLSEIEEEYHRRALKLAEESDIVLFVGGLDHEYDIEGDGYVPA